jgi:hypothetical protein
VNGSQLKFLDGTRPISQIGPKRGSLLTQPRPHSYWIAIDPQNRVRKLESLWKHELVQVKPQVSRRQQEIARQAFYCLTDIPSNTF